MTTEPGLLDFVPCSDCRVRTIDSPLVQELAFLVVDRFKDRSDMPSQPELEFGCDVADIEAQILDHHDEGALDSREAEIVADCLRRCHIINAERPNNESSPDN